MEGSCAAWAADHMIKENLPHAYDLVGVECPENGWVVDLEMAGHVQQYVNMIRKEGGAVSTERFVSLSPLVEGTLDNSATFINGVVRVRDLKYGRRTIETDAPQVVIYLGAVVGELLEAGHPVTEMWTEIYQPRGFHKDGIHRRRPWSMAELEKVCSWLIQRAELCHQPNPVATPGPWCDECEGAAGCVALQQTAVELMGVIESRSHRQMNGQELGAALQGLREARKVIDAAAKAIEAEALARARRGERIGGYSLQEKYGNRKLNRSRDAVRALTGVDPVVEKEMSPAQLEGAGVATRLVDMVSAKPSTGFKLERLDPRDLAKQFPQS